MNALWAEREAIEYVLGLDGLGLGREAKGVYVRALVRDVRPVLLRQLRLAEAAQAGLYVDAAEARRLDEALCAAWARCLESLRVLWLTQGRGVEVAP